MERKSWYIPKQFDCLENNCGNKVCQEGRRCRSCSKSGFRNPMKISSVAQKVSRTLTGRKFSDSHINNMRKSAQSRDNNTYYFSSFNKHPKTCKCMRCKMSRGETKGSNHWNWKNGITELGQDIRNLIEYKEWRDKVFARDNRICQNCDQLRGNIEAHHKKEFHKIFEEFLREYSQFSPFEDKETLLKLSLSYSPFWDIDNGQTLCTTCHQGIESLK